MGSRPAGSLELDFCKRRGMPATRKAFCAVGGCPLVGLALFLLAGPSQASPSPLGRPTASVFSVRDGLPQNSVQGIATDRAGYLWVGTQDGAARFDGRQWEVVDLAPSQSTSRHITAVAASADGAVWLGTLAGLLRFADGQFQRFTAARGELPDDRITALLFQPAAQGDRLWVGTEQGIARFAAGTWTSSVGAPPELARAAIRALAAGPHGELWVGTDQGLMVNDQGQWLTPSTPLELAPPITSLTVTDVRLWVGTKERGLWCRQGDRWSRWGLAEGLPDDRITSLTSATSPGLALDLWVGTLRGVARFNGQSFRVYSPGNSALPSRSIRSLAAVSYPGRSVIWVGTFDAGVVALHPDDPEVLDAESSPLSEGVYAIAETGPPTRPEYWFGTLDSGVWHWVDGRFTVINRSNSPLPADEIQAFLVPAEGHGLWIGTTAGLAFYDPDYDPSARPLGGQPWKVFTPANSDLPDANIFALAEDPQSGALWVGTAGGLARFHGQDFTIYDPTNSGLPDAAVRALRLTRVDGDPVLFVGTRSGGLARFAKDGWTSFQAGSSPLPNNWVNALLDTHEADGHALWVATDGGLARLDLTHPEPRWSIFNAASQPPLPHAMVFDVEQDFMGRICAMTGNGAACLEPDSAQGYRVQLLTPTTGGPALEGNQNAALVDRSGRLWVGTSAGVLKIVPPPRIAPWTAPLAITRLSVAGQERPLPTSELDLAHHENNLELTFALRYPGARDPDDLVYRTQFAGLEPTPSAWTPDPQRRFDRLPPGAYVFRVWAQDRRDPVGGAAELRVLVGRPLWATGWAWILYLVGAGLLFEGLLKLRVKTHQRREQELAAKVTERTAELERSQAELRQQTQELQAMVPRLRAAQEEAERSSRAKTEFLATMSHELRTPMNAVIGMASLLLETQPTAKQREYVQAIRMGGETLLAIINDILDLSKVEAGRLELEHSPLNLRAVIEEALEINAPLALNKRLELGYALAPEVPEGILGDAARLRQVLVNLVSNSVKFTPAGSVFLTVDGTTNPQELCFSVRDTGIGIPPDRLPQIFDSFVQADTSTTRRFGGTGLGLAIAQRMVEAMGGRIWAESVEGQGTTLHFTLLAFPADTSGPVDVLPPTLTETNILVASPSPLVRQTLAGQLTALHLTAVLATSLEEVRAAVTGGARLAAALLDFRWFALSQEPSWPKNPPLPVIQLGNDAQHLTADASSALPLLLPARCSTLKATLRRAIVQDDEPPTMDAPSEPTSNTGIRVLLAEDNPVNQIVGLHMLEQLGYSADLAADGRETLDAIYSRGYEVVLLDIHMPEIDGLEVAQKLRAEPPPQRPHLIAMTASVLPAEREHYRAVGIDQVLPKPVRLEDLRRVLRQFDRTLTARLGTADKPVLDPTLIEKLWQLEQKTQPGLVQQVVADFLAQGDQYLSKLEQAIRTEAWPQVAFLAHALKGSSAQVGAARLSSHAAELELRAKEPSTVNCREWLAVITQDLVAVRPLLTALVAQLVAAKPGATRSS